MTSYHDPFICPVCLNEVRVRNEAEHNKQRHGVEAVSDWRLDPGVTGSGNFRCGVRPAFGSTENYRRHAVLFNDITQAPTRAFIDLSDREAIADYLWSQGWRRDVRPEDVTE